MLSHVLNVRSLSLVNRLVRWGSLEQNFMPALIVAVQSQNRHKPALTVVCH